MNWWRRGFAVVCLGGLGCLGAPAEEAGSARTSRLPALECGGTVAGDFFMPTTIGDAVAGNPDLLDEYTVDAAPGVTITLDFSATYDDDFGFSVVAYDEETGAEIARHGEGSRSEGQLSFQAGASGRQRVAVTPMYRSVRMNLRECGYGYGYGRGNDGGYGYGYACDYAWTSVGIGSGEAGGGAYRLSARCEGSGSISCVVGGLEGVCREVSECDGNATPGYCSGSSSVQCCTATTPVTDDAGITGGVPASWRCAPGFYGASDGCDCGCGARDPDCDDPEQELIDYCGYGQTCRQDGECELLIPPEWHCPAAMYGSGGDCNCNCGAPDPDCNQDTGYC